MLVEMFTSLITQRTPFISRYALIYKCYYQTALTQKNARDLVRF